MEHEETSILLARISKNLDHMDLNQETPISLAVRKQKYRIVKHLLINGADANLRDTNNLTPLEKAKLQSDKKIISILVSCI
jgi:ankyrin repeat protein